MKRCNLTDKTLYNIIQMARQGHSCQIEVLGVSDDINEGMIEMLLENRNKMGRRIPVTDVVINKTRKAALVTLQNQTGKQKYHV